MLSRRLGGWGDTVPLPRASPCQCATSQGPRDAGSSGGRSPAVTAPQRGRSTTGCGGSGREPQRDHRRPHPHGGQCGREGRAPRSRRQHPGLLISDKGFILPQLRADLGGGDRAANAPAQEHGRREASRLRTDAGEGPADGQDRDRPARPALFTSGAHGRGTPGTSPAGSREKCSPILWPSPSTCLPDGSHSSSRDCFNHEKCT